MLKKKGFTLIELLVVISIIAVLMAVMMPAMGKAREQAKSIVCRSNLKNIVLGASLWSQDHDDWSLPGFWYYPSGTKTSLNRSVESLAPYLQADVQSGKDVYVCPSAKKEDFFDFDIYDDSTNSIDRNHRLTYGINSYITIYVPGRKGPGDIAKPNETGGGWAGPDDIYAYSHGCTKNQNIRRPGETLYFIDTGYPFADESSIDPHKKIEDLAFSGSSRWHSKKTGQDYGYGNIAWVDGHVSKEPEDFADPVEESGRNPRWWYYFFDH